MSIKRAGMRNPRVASKPSRTKFRKGRGRNNQNGGIRANADRAQAQGVGAITQVPFGNKRDRKEPAKHGIGLECWDALSSCHLPLPRAVGPYLTVRLTRRFSTKDAVNVFGFFQNDFATGMGPVWTNLVHVACPVGQTASNPAAHAQWHHVDTSTLGPAATWTPAAMTVQIMNANALASSVGILYAGVLSTQTPYGGSAVPWHNLGEDFVQFMRPRMMSAGKLVMRGVQVQTYPLNMATLADFTPVHTLDTPAAVWPATIQPSGFAPIVVYNPTRGSPAAEVLELDYLVTTEWRVRFDLSSAASAAHVLHPAATESQWNSKIEQALKLGHGVVDIVERVANIGSTVGLL